MTNAAARLLIVDDEPPLLGIIKSYLSRLGYQVVTSASAESAWSKIEPDPSAWALVMIDMTIGGMGGEEFARRVLAADASIRILATSGYPTDLAALEKIAPGRVAFLHKPFPPETLASEVERLLRSGAAA